MGCAADLGRIVNEKEERVLKEAEVRHEGEVDEKGGKRWCVEQLLMLEIVVEMYTTL